MKTLGEFLGLSKQNEMLILTLLGICFTIFDPSIFNLHSNLHKVWSVRMDPSRFTFTIQLYVKYIISTIVLVKTFTVHIYLAFYIVMLWPAVFEERPGLLLPWLIVSSIKCLLMGAMTLSTGLYICLVYKFSTAACWDFLLTQVMDHGPSLYMWFCVLSYFKHLKMNSIKIYPARSTPSTLFDVTGRRRRVKGLVLDINTLTDDRQLISTSTVDTLIHQLNVGAKCSKSRSLDSLLTKITVDVKKEEILKMSDVEIDEEDAESIRDKTLRSLHVSESNMERNRINKVDEKDKEEISQAVFLQSIIKTPQIIKNSKPTNLPTNLLENLSETEIKSIRLDLEDPSNKIIKHKNLNLKVSKLPRRNKTVGTSYTSIGTKEKCSSCDSPRRLESKTSINFPQKTCLNTHSTKAASVSRAVTANRPIIQKSKSCIPKTETFFVSKLPQVIHTPFKQDGYTLAYMEKTKNETSTKLDTDEEVVVTQSKDNVK